LSNPSAVNAAAAAAAAVVASIPVLLGQLAILVIGPLVDNTYSTYGLPVIEPTSAKAVSEK